MLFPKQKVKLFLLVIYSHKMKQFFSLSFMTITTLPVITTLNRLNLHQEVDLYIKVIASGLNFFSYISYIIHETEHMF